jgi:hypothetical protein
MNGVKYPLHVTLSSLVLNRLKADLFPMLRISGKTLLDFTLPWPIPLLSWKEQHEDKIEPGEVME